MTATARRAVVAEVQAAVPVSEREACRYVGVARSTLRYQPSRDDAPLRAQLEQLAVERPRRGYRRLTVLLRRGGVLVNHKRVYRAAGLAVRRRHWKRVAVPRRPLVLASRPNERWSMDFVTDRFGAERRFRALAIVDDFTRECLALEVDTSLPGAPRVPGARRARGGAGRAGDDRDGQWPRVRRPRPGRLGLSPPRPPGLHSAGEADAERLRRELQRQAAR